jgi:hypothetical protein
MDTFIADASTPINGSATGNLLSTDKAAIVQYSRIEDLNVETTATNELLPTDRKWAIRFRSDGTVTIVLGMKDHGRGWFSGYSAALVVGRLGVPLRQIRIYYSGTLPAVLQTPVQPPTVLYRGHLGPVTCAVADLIERMCDRVIERGRLAFAAIARVGAADIGFDQSIGRFFVLDRARSGSILEIAHTLRGKWSPSTEFTSIHHRGDEVSSVDVQIPLPTGG